MLSILRRNIRWVRAFISGTLGALLIGILSALATAPASTFQETGLAHLFFWLFGMGMGPLLLRYALGFLLGALLIEGTMTLWEGSNQPKRLRRQYLKALYNENKSLHPREFPDQPRPLIAVNLSMEEILIPQYFMPSRPVYDAPGAQEGLIDEIRNDPRLNAEQRESLIGRIRERWYSDLVQNKGTAGQQQPVELEKLFHWLTAQQPAAIILGTPGAGKSTILRWCALRMARALLPEHLPLPTFLAPAQFPLLVRVSDYVRALSTNEKLSILEFLKVHLTETYHDTALFDLLLEELQKGHCLGLFDGLDEAPTARLRQRVVAAIADFIQAYTSPHSATSFNRFLITSRIASYEPGPLDSYVHCTLREMDERQIATFLDKWYPALDRYLARTVLVESELQANLAKSLRRSRELLAAIQKNSSIKRLATNPLMLTILVLMHRQGLPLPQRRIDLYRVVTRTLLETWNQPSERPSVPREELPLAESILSNLAYRLHTNPILSQDEVFAIVRQSMAEFYQQAAHSIKGVEDYVCRLREGSGLFIQAGSDLFCFLHRTFREYFVALYLRPMANEDLQQFIREQYASLNWREPLLLLLAYKGGANNPKEVDQAGDLLRTIAVTGSALETVLYRNYLFAAECLVDCNVWSIKKELQINIAYRLFERYGDSQDLGRYAQLQQEIERVLLLWLRAQPEEISQQYVWPALLEAWRNALVNVEKHPTRQAGAARLLAVLALELSTCPTSVLDALIPPLLQLIDLPLPVACLQRVASALLGSEAHTDSVRVREYAMTTLRLLGPAGPAGWLHEAWLQGEKESVYLALLTRHSLERDFLLTPAALPDNPQEGENWDRQRQLRQTWREVARDRLRSLQQELLQASDQVRYPYACLLEQLCQAELAQPEIPWSEIWYPILRSQIEQGKSATYQLSLALLRSINRDDPGRMQEIIEILMHTLKTPGPAQEQALLMLIYHNLTEVLSLRCLSYPLFFHAAYIDKYHTYLLYRRNIQRMLIESATEQADELTYLKYSRQFTNSMQDIQDRQDFLPLRYLLDERRVLETLCMVLVEQQDSQFLCLLALYSLLDATTRARANEVCQQVQAALLEFAGQGRALTSEEYVMLDACSRKIARLQTSNRSARLSASTGVPTTEGETPSELLAAFARIKPSEKLAEPVVTKLLDACADTRPLDEELRQVTEADTVHQVAWKYILQPSAIEENALVVSVRALESQHPLKCAAGALLLQYNKALLRSAGRHVHETAARIVVRRLADVRWSCRLLDLPAGVSSRRLDDVLFETLLTLGDLEPFSVS